MKKIFKVLSLFLMLLPSFGLAAQEVLLTNCKVVVAGESETIHSLDHKITLLEDEVRFHGVSDGDVHNHSLTDTLDVSVNEPERIVQIGTEDGDIVVYLYVFDELVTVGLIRGEEQAEYYLVCAEYVE